MRAVAYRAAGPIDGEDALLDVELPEPAPSGRDLLVEVRAVSVNPVDAKLRQGAAPEGGAWRTLGFDAAGTVRSTGPDATLFGPGEAVFYAGAIDRPGANAELHLVDERIVGAKPRSLGWAEAAALPLTTITAWEMLFDRLDVRRPVPGAAPAVLIVGGAGGVGSIATQLARRLTDLVVIATASRPETAAWARGMGAHHIVDHSRPLAAEVGALGLDAPPAFVLSTTQTDRHAADIARLIAPQGRLALTDALADAGQFKRKSVSIHWEYMFTRSLFGTADMGEQGRLLGEVARLVDEGTLRSTMSERYGPIGARALREMHRRVETGGTRGKLVAEGWANPAEAEQQAEM